MPPPVRAPRQHRHPSPGPSHPGPGPAAAARAGLVSRAARRTAPRRAAPRRRMGPRRGGSAAPAYRSLSVALIQSPMSGGGGVSERHVTPVLDRGVGERHAGPGSQLPPCLTRQPPCLSGQAPDSPGVTSSLIPDPLCLTRKHPSGLTGPRESRLMTRPRVGACP